MRKLLLVLLFPALLFGQKASVDYSTLNHVVIKPPSAPGATYDLDFTGLNIGGLAGGPGPGGGTPGGQNQQVQFNNSFVFGGVPYLLFNGTAITQQVGNRYFLLDPTDNTKRLQISIAGVPSGTLKTLFVSDNQTAVTASSGATSPQQFATGIGPDGIITYAQPLFSDLGGVLPLSQTTQNTNKILGRYSAGVGPTQEITIGLNLTLNPITGVLDAAGGGGTPGGSTTQFQFNNAGVFGGTNSLLFTGGFITARSTVFRIFDNSDPTATFNFSTANIPTGTNETVVIPNSSTPTVVAGLAAPVANKWVQYITTLGVQTLTQPNFTDLAGSATLGQQNIPIAKERFVDPVNGSDITGATNLAKPYLTIAAACAAASSGDVIYLYPNPTGYDQSTTALVIPAGVTIVGAGPDTTLIKGAVTPSTRGVLEPSTASAVYNVTIQNTAATGYAFGVGGSSGAFTSAYIGGSKIIGNSAAVDVSRTGSTGLVLENCVIQAQGDCFFQDTATATTEFRNCTLISDGTATTASRGLDVTNGTVLYNYGNITVGNSTNTNIGIRADGATTRVEAHGVRISNSGGGTTNNDLRQTTSAFLGKDNVTRPDGGALVTSGTITELSRYAIIDNNLSDFPNLGSGTRGDIIFRNATGWTKLAAGLDGNVLTTHGNTADPNWLTVSGTGGIVDNAVYGPAWLGVTTSAPGKDTIYNYLHLMDTNDDGKINVLDQVAGITNTDSLGIIQTPLAAPTGAIVGTTDTQTLSNKRMVRREQAVVAPTPAPTIATNNFDSVHYTGITANMTAITTTGTPNPGDTLIIDFTDDGTPRTLAWDVAKFEPSPGQVLPTATTASTRLDVGFRWNPVTGKWRCLASSNASAGGGGTGTVTSVGISGTNGISVSGSPVSTSGTIALGLPITLAGTSGKTLTVSNSLTLAGTDGSTLNVGAGGTLGSNAFTSTAFLTASNISDAAWAATWLTDTTAAASRHAMYVWGHTFDTDDNGLPNKLDMANGITKVTSNVVGPATAGTDYADLAFKTVSVSGQSDVVADSAGDTLTLAAGSNVTITTTPGTDTVTIASTGGGAGGVPTGTGFYHVTSGVMDAAALGQTGGGNAVRATNAVMSGTSISDGNFLQGTNSAFTYAIFGQRASDSSPVGHLLTFKNTANTVTLWDIDVTGTLNTGIIPWARITSTPTTLAGYGITDATSLAFKTISVSGQSDVVADTATDTLTLVAGSNITLTTTAGTDTVTIAATGGGTPGGSNTQVQFNDVGAFGGDADLTWDKTGNTLTVTGGVSTIGSFTGYYVNNGTAGIIGDGVGGGVGGLRFQTSTNQYSAFLGTTELAIPLANYFGWAPLTTNTTMDTALYRNAGGVVEINNGTAGTYRDLICRNITISGGNFSGRINPRASGGCDETSSATSTPNSDACDQWDITALAAADVFVAPSGTPVNGQNLVIRILDNGTARALTFPTASSGQYWFSSDMPAPTTTVLSKTIYLLFKWNAARSRWDNLAQMNNF